VDDQERAVRRELAGLARSEKGRQLLQLALRGIQESGRGLTYGCWVKRDGGVAGCLFQHAYWEGTRDGGTFEVVDGTPSGEIKSFVGEEDFALVMQSIRAFDALGKRRFNRWQRGRFGIPVRKLDEQRWRATIERLLIEALAESPGGAAVPSRIEPVPPALDARA
jgi:hypothetical protein